jgi:hypothetical protein
MFCVYAVAQAVMNCSVFAVRSRGIHIAVENATTRSLVVATPQNNQ